MHTHRGMTMVDSINLLDIEGCLDRLAGDSSLLIRLYELFLADAPKKLSAIHHFAESGELYQLGRIAHSLKGAAATIGATRLQAISFQLEQAAKEEDVDSVAALSSQLDSVCAKTMQAMKDYCAQYS